MNPRESLAASSVLSLTVLLYIRGCINTEPPQHLQRWPVMHHVLLNTHILRTHTMADNVFTATGGLKKPFIGLDAV